MLGSNDAWIRYFRRQERERPEMYLKPSFIIFFYGLRRFCIIVWPNLVISIKLILLHIFSTDGGFENPRKKWCVCGGGGGGGVGCLPWENPPMQLIDHI